MSGGSLTYYYYYCIIRPTMLASANVLDLEYGKRQLNLQQTAVLTPMFRTVANKLANTFVHAQAGGSAALPLPWPAGCR
jgi:hypothetical protein